MPTFFSFQQGSEDRSYHAQDASPLLGRFRAVPREASGRTSGRAGGGSQLGLLSASTAPARGGLGPRGSVHIGYGAIHNGGAKTTRPSGFGLGADIVSDSDEEEETDSDTENEAFVAQEGGMALLLWRMRRLATSFEDTWVTPKPGRVKRIVKRWWSRWFVLVVLPAALVSPPAIANYIQPWRPVWLIMST
jgi:hypothetical protein